jgi:hypothetical protein
MTKAQLQDQALILLAAHFLGDGSDIYRLTKLLFRLRHDDEAKSRGATYSARFPRFPHGPFAPELYDETQALRSASVLVFTPPKNRGRVLTGLGRRLASTLLERVQPAEVARIRTQAKRLARMTFNEIKADCYALEVIFNGQTTTVGNVPEGEVVFGEPARNRWVLSDDDLDALHATLVACRPATPSDGTLADLEALLSETPD